MTSKKDSKPKVHEIKVDTDDPFTMTLLTLVIKLMKQTGQASITLTMEDEDACYETNVGFDFPEDSDDCIVFLSPKTSINKKELN